MILEAVVALGLLGVALGGVLGYVAVRFRREGTPLADAIDRILPQTQCAQCGFPGCRPYAEAIASGEADINRCPPGGEAGIRALAELLGREAKPLDAERGVEKPPVVAWIDEAVCIGCTKCIQACPVDAILGAPKLMHTVLVDECTGCELCVAPCPVDCIHLLPVQGGIEGWRAPRPTGSLQTLVRAATAP
jgi:electron transport complex protein RnfB